MYADSHIQRLDPLSSHYWLQVWQDSDKEEGDLTKLTDTLKTEVQSVSHANLS